jgi:hypothetical protein
MIDTTESQPPSSSERSAPGTKYLNNITRIIQLIVMPAKIQGDSKKLPSGNFW